MMRYDNLTSPNNTLPEREYNPKPAAVPATAPASEPLVESMADREVPLPNGSGTSVLHDWLDGSVESAVVRATPGGNDAVDLWTKINDEAELLRRRTTPLYVHKRIMEALPDDIYQVDQPWYRRSVVMKPTVIIATAAALVGLGALIARIATH